jgi:hypothetical protein
VALRFLDIQSCYAGPPEMLVAQLIVAELIGGIALPEPDHVSVGVLAADGSRVQVIAVSDRDGWFGGGPNRL